VLTCSTESIRKTYFYLSLIYIATLFLHVLDSGDFISGATF